MTTNTGDTQALHQILEVTRKLAAPFDLDTMLAEVVDASREVLNADRGTVFLYDELSNELVVRVGTDLDQIRIPADKGIVGESAQTRKLINVPDCYADDRFNRAIDKQTGYRSRCMLTIPLIGYEESLIGVLQILNKNDGVFDEKDEFVGQALAAQAAVVLHRARITEQIIASERLDREISVARDVQMGTLPKNMPRIRGYEFGGAFAPTDQTGGDLYDFVPLDEHRLFLLMGDATGHGIGPALSATQVRAMLRVAIRLESSLDDAFIHINDQLCEDLPDDRFVTGFFGLLDAETHTIRFHSGGQGPIMHFQAEMSEYDWHPATTFPLGYMPQTELQAPVCSVLEPGDVFGLISDGIYEYENETGKQFGRKGVMQVIDHNPHASAQELVDLIMAAAREHGGTAPQADDITIVLARRLPEQWGTPMQRKFPRHLDSLTPLYEFAEEILAANELGEAVRFPVHLAMEELFVNMVKYNPGISTDIEVTVTTAANDGIRVTLVDNGGVEFDVTATREVDINAPLDERTPGGLGVHLIQNLVDSLEYRYQDGRGEVIFTKGSGNNDV